MRWQRLKIFDLELGTARGLKFLELGLARGLTYLELGLARGLTYLELGTARGLTFLETSFHSIQHTRIHSCLLMLAN